MKKILYILYSLLSTLTITSCQPEPLDITLEDYEPKLVIASQVLPGEVMFIGLTRSFTVLSDAGSSGSGDSSTFSKILVDSALVTIEHGGTKDTLIKLAPGLFASLGKLENPGTNYTLKVTDYDYNNSVYANAEMLTKFKFDTVYPVISKSNSDTTITIHAEFSDDPDDDNFYLINVYSRESINSGLDLNSFFKNGENKIQTSQIYSDTDLEGSEYSFDLKVDNLEISDSIAVSLSNISESYYNFLKKREKSGNIFTEITSEPINYPSNIQGGLGFFNTHFPDVRYFDLKDF